MLVISVPVTRLGKSLALPSIAALDSLDSLDFK
jgi:hypothetical protein